MSQLILVVYPASLSSRMLFFSFVEGGVQHHVANKYQGTVAFAWGYAAWLPSVFILPPVSIVFGVVDAIIATFIVITTHYQTGYTPHSISHCKGSGAHDFQLPPGANESFFDAAARLNATVTTPFKMCKSFVVEWQYGIAIS